MSDANFQAHQRESHHLRERLFALEAKAGIRDEPERFNEANRDNDLRRLYFSVRDKELRKELIAQYRDLLRHADGYTPSRILDAEQEHRALELKGFSPPWAGPAAVVTFAVWVGWSVAAIPGALAGAVAGFFVGNAYIANQRNAHLREIAAAKAEVDELKEERKKEERPFGNPLLFSEQEEQSGGEDEGPQPEPDIHWFSRAGWASLASKEIEKGASVEAENNESWGSKPLHRAAANCNANVVKVLLDASANPNAINRLHSFTPLHSAAAAGSAEAAKMLIEAGASVEARDRYGFQPLHRAAEGGDPESIRLLATAGAGIESLADDTNRRPLHLAARAGHAEAIEALLALGADPSPVNSHGATPLDLASWGEGKRFERAMAALRTAGGIAGKGGRPAATPIASK